MWIFKSHIKQYIKSHKLKKCEKTLKKIKKDVDFEKVVSYKTFHRQGRASGEKRSEFFAVGALKGASYKK